MKIIYRLVESVDYVIAVYNSKEAAEKAVSELMSSRENAGIKYSIEEHKEEGE